MAVRDIAYIGCTFSGHCNNHKGGADFTGTFTHGGSPVISINGNPVCVTGTYGQASCGCLVKAIGGSTILSLNGLPVAREGDAIEAYSGGGITGKITSGCPWMATD